MSKLDTLQLRIDLNYMITLRSLDASLAIPTRVLCFEDSGLHRRTPVRPVLLTGQTGTHRSDPPVRPVWRCCTSVFGLGFVDQQRNPVVFW
jgi:hypothetical protein